MTTRLTTRATPLLRWAPSNKITRACLPPCRCLSKISYYNSQAGEQVAYYDDVQVHAFLASEAQWGQTGVEAVAGLASIVADGGLSQLLLPPFQIDGEGHEEASLPPRAIFLPPGCCEEDSLEQVRRSQEGLLCGCHLTLHVSEGGREAWQEIVNAVEDTKTKGLRVRVTIVGALSVSPTTLSLAACLLADAGADLLVLESLGDENGEDDLENAFEALTNNDIQGIPISMRVGVRFGTLSGNDTEEARAHATALACHAASLGIVHFDLCPLGKVAMGPGSLLSAFEEAGVESRLKDPPLSMDKY